MVSQESKRAKLCVRVVTRCSCVMHNAATAVPELLLYMYVLAYMYQAPLCP